MGSPTEPTELLPGFTTWDNPGNGFHVVKLHYTADPAKRTPEWKSRAMQGMPLRGWQREYELSFEAPLGAAVVPEFGTTHVRSFAPSKARILCGWDFGQVSPAAVFAQKDIHGRTLIVGELVLQGATLAQFVDANKARTIELFGRPGERFDAGDPAADSLLDVGQVRRELQQRGILLHTSPRKKDSYDNLRKEFLRHVHVPGEGLTPATLVHPRCVTLIEALQGAFHYSERQDLANPKPVPTHPYKDVVDALRYLNDNLAGSGDDFMESMKRVASADIVWP